MPIGKSLPCRSARYSLGLRIDSSSGGHVGDISWPTASAPAPHAHASHSAEGTRARLLDAALTLFAMNSFAGTSLQMIADHVGITKAAVYHHFKTRDEILASVIEPTGHELRAAIEAAEERRSPTARAETMLTGFVDVTIRHRRVIALICTDAGVTHTACSREDVTLLIARLLRLLTAHQSPPESEVNATPRGERHRIGRGLAGSASPLRRGTPRVPPGRQSAHSRPAPPRPLARAVQSLTMLPCSSTTTVRQYLSHSSSTCSGTLPSG